MKVYLLNASFILTHKMFADFAFYTHLTIFAIKILQCCAQYLQLKH
jgi:hypothetical protein